MNMIYIERLIEATNGLKEQVALRRNAPLNNKKDLDNLNGIIIDMIITLNNIKLKGSYEIFEKNELLSSVQQMEKVIENDPLSPFKHLVSNGLKSSIELL